MTKVYDVTSNVNTLYDVTLDCLKENGKSFNDVRWIGCKDFSIDINDFIKYSKNINSRTKDVLSVIPRDLVIVGDDFWLERIEFFEDLLMDTIYDCWKYKEKPKKPKENRTIYSLNINDSVYTKSQMRKEMGINELDYFLPKLKFLTKEHCKYYTK